MQCDWSAFQVTFICFTECVQVRFELHEGSCLGLGWSTSAGICNESWRTHQWCECLQHPKDVLIWRLFINLSQCNVQLSWRASPTLFLQKKYRQLPDKLRFTQVADSPDILHAKNSYMQCSEARPVVKKKSVLLHLWEFRSDLLLPTFQRLYKSGNSESKHKYTLPPDHPDFIRAKINAQQISDVCQV